MGRTFLTLLLLLFAAAAEARQIDVAECLRLAVEASGELKAAEAEKRAAAEEVNIARAALLPSLRLGGHYTLNDKSERLKVEANSLDQNLPPQTGYISTGDKDTYGISFTLHQPLFTGGRLLGTYQAASHQAEAADHVYSRRMRQVLHNARKQFNDALISEDLIRAAEKRVAAAKKRLGVIEARVQEGISDQSELLQAEAEVARADSRLVRARNRSALVIASLKKLIGADPREPLTVSGTPGRLLFSATLEELVSAGTAGREDLQATAARSRAADAELGVARSGYYPALSLDGSYLRQKETGFARDSLWSMTVRMEWSLFEWGRTAAGVRKAAALRSRSESLRDDLLKSVVIEIEEGWREVMELESAAIADEKTLKAREAALRKSIDRYRNGAERLDEVADREAALWEAFETYCQCVTALGTALANLEVLTATDLSRWMTVAEFYRPDFSRYAFSDTPRAQEPAPAPTPAPPSPPPPAPLPPARDGSFREKDIAPAAQPGPPRDPAHKQFRLQLGAYHDLRGATEKAARLSHRLRGSTVEIILEDSLYKILAGPFDSIAAARHAAADMQLKEYLVKAQ